MAVQDVLRRALQDPLSFESFRATVRARMRSPSMAEEGRFEVEAMLVEVEDKLQALLEEDPLAVGLHELAADFWDFRGDEELTRLHDSVLRALAESIALSGDGRTMETAYIVDTIAEEYLLLRERGLRRIEQALIPKEDRAYDRLTCVDEEGVRHELWFDISAFYPGASGA